MCVCYFLNGSNGGHDSRGDDGRGPVAEARPGAGAEEGRDGAAPHEPARFRREKNDDFAFL